MFFNKIALSDLKVENQDLKKRISDLENQVSNYDRLIAEINSDLTKCEPVIDFTTMRVFSIERHVSNNKPCTILGYFLNEPVVSSDGEMVVDRDVTKEWTLYCSNERHAELVEKFKAYNASK